MEAAIQGCQEKQKEMRVFTWNWSKLQLACGILNALPNTNFKSNKNFMIFPTEMTKLLLVETKMLIFYLLLFFNFAEAEQPECTQPE